MQLNLREFVRTAVILTPAREASRVGTALQRQDPQDPLDPVECSFLIEFETSIELERFDLQKHRVFDDFFKPMFKNTRFLITFLENVIKT